MHKHVNAARRQQAENLSAGGASQRRRSISAQAEHLSAGGASQRWRSISAQAEHLSAGEESQRRQAHFRFSNFSLSVNISPNKMAGRETINYSNRTLEICAVYFINKFIYFIFGCIGSLLLCTGFSLAAASGGPSSLRRMGFSLRWLLLLRSKIGRAHV